MRATSPDAVTGMSALSTRLLTFVDECNQDRRYGGDEWCSSLEQLDEVVNV
jgi:hypothetical protein